MEFFGLVFKPYIIEGKENFEAYIYETKDEVIYAVKQKIGSEHPFLENVSATSYYEKEDDGYYFLGYDKTENLYFLPLN